MNNELVYLVVGIFVVVIVVMIWNNKNENLYIPNLTPNQVYQGDYTNELTTPNPRVWSCPSGTSGPGCRLKHKAVGNGGYRPPGGYGTLSPGRYPSEGYSHRAPGEGYRYSGMEPASDHTPIDIIAPPFTDEVYLLGFGIGEGIYGSGRFTSEMFG